VSGDRSNEVLHRRGRRLQSVEHVPVFSQAATETGSAAIQVQDAAAKLSKQAAEL
jgi:hypothetical protein